MSLYDIVGVKINATKEQIKKAYRKRAATVHPDHGGDTSKFRELAVAYNILFDEEKRKRYDDGESAESISKASISEDQEINQNLIVLFIQIVAQHDPKYTDIHKTIVGHINKQLNELKGLVDAENKVIARLETAIGRLKTTSDENIFAIGATGQINSIKRKIEELEKQKNIGSGMLKRLEAFSYEFEENPFGQQMQGMAFMQMNWDPRR